MDKLTTDPKLQAARIAADITIAAMTSTRGNFTSFHTAGDSSAMQLWNACFSDVIRAISESVDLREQQK